ncbi:ATP-binding protein [Sphingobacterium sp. SG20118]|uniref:ATP-binding protein n=1 Tax=Sphingobacterium sp. SG20118 TaxID=3367156 RepID=UPI0037DFC91A
MRNNTKITNASIESAGLPKDAKHVIAEYIWNGFDAKAAEVSVDITSNALGFIESISIRDNGEGIAQETLDYSFGNFLDSLKKNSLKRSSYTRGKKGKGRFSFSLFATRAIWDTTVMMDDNLVSYSIRIDRDTKEHYDIRDIKSFAKAKGTGTSVKLAGIFNLTAAALESEEFTDFLALEFGWYLHLNRDWGYRIRINGTVLNYDNLIQETDSKIFTLYSNQENSYSFLVNYIRWKQPIGDRYYYYFLNNNKTEVAKLLSSFNNNAIDFHHSVYIESDFFDNFKQDDIAVSADDNLFSEKEQQQVYRKLLAELRDFLVRKQKKYIREQAVTVKLEELEKKDLLPRYSSTELDIKRKKILLSLIQELYIADPRAFVGIKADLIRTYLGLLDLLLQTDRKQDILPLFENAIALSDKERDTIRKILER